MHWIALSEKDTAIDTLEKRPWEAAEQFRANSSLTPQEYSDSILGFIFLRFAARCARPERAGASTRRASRTDDPASYHAEGVLYLTAEPRFDYLLNRPETENIGAKANAAMRDVEKHNPKLVGALPKGYARLTLD